MTGNTLYNTPLFAFDTIGERTEGTFTSGPILITTGYRITPGRKNSLYTLRKVWEWHNRTTGESAGGDDFVCNLHSADADDARDRAFVFLEGKIPRERLIMTGDASGVREDLTHTMTFGKYNGRDIASIDGSYLAWCLANCPNKFSKKTREYIKALPAVHALISDEKEAREKRELAAAARESEKEAREATWEAEKALSNYIGDVGRRIELTVEKKFSKTYDSHYGTGVFLVLKVDNDSVKCLGTAAALFVMHDAAPGETFRIKGTVKAHEEYKGEKSTMLSRVVIIKQEEEKR